MMRSLYSGVAGLKTHQTKMDVIGNNIANVNTMGFKSSSVLFRDVLYQTTSSATGATSQTGGTNATQIGLGTKVASVQASISENGAAQSTNNPYDLMLTGSDFFVVSRGGNNYFTKVGSFNVDGSGCLVTSNGCQVMGWQVDPDNPGQIKKDVVSALYPESEENKVSAPEMTSQSFLKGNVDLTDPALRSVDGAMLSLAIYDSLGYNYTCKFSLKQVSTTTGGTTEYKDAQYELKIESIKDANNVEILGDDDVDTAKVEEGGYDAYITAYKEDGTIDTTVTKKDSIIVTFNPDTGAFEAVGGNKNGMALLEITPKKAAAGKEAKPDVFTGMINNEKKSGIDMNFSNMTMFESDGKTTVKMIRGSVESEGGGRAMGKMQDVSIDNAGMIYGVYSNGETRLIGQIAVANFTNPMALEAIGDSMYVTTQNSGEFDGIGVAVTESGGKMTQGVLEMSNVDLSAEFTEMITTQRGFQANSRIITTSDSMLEELVNLKR